MSGDGLYKRQGSENWYALIWVDGQRFRRCTETPNKKEARLKREEIKSQLIAEIQAAKQDGGVTWKDACIKWLKADGRSLNDRYILGCLDYPNRPLSQCTAKSFEPALAHLGNSTHNRYRSIIQAVCNLSGHKLKLPTKATKNSRLRILTKQEWDVLYKALPDHLKPLAHFSILTGLRQHNVTHLRWDQINLAAKKAWVTADESKSGKAFGFHLPDKAMKILAAQEGKSKEWVFPYFGRGPKKQGEPLKKIKNAWLLAQERAGLGKFKRWEDADGKAHKEWQGDFTWHGLRHTWASWHLMAGTPIEVVAELGGWEDLRMVQAHYGHLAGDHLAQYANNARPWSVKKTATQTSHSEAIS